MRKLCSLLLVSILSWQAVTAQQGNKLPTTPIKTLQGKTVAFNEIVKPGQVTLISFWATWCIPCKKEIRAVRNNLAKWKEQVNMEYVTISIDDSRATAQVRSYAKSQGWDFPAYLDTNSDLKRSLNFQNVPFTIIVDKEGKVAFMHTGFEEGSENVIFEKIKEIAAK